MARRIDGYPEHMNLTQAYNFLDISETTFRKWISNGKVKPIKQLEDSKRLFNKQDLIPLLEPYRYKKLYKELYYFEDLLAAIRHMDELIKDKFNNDEQLLKLNENIDEITVNLMSVVYDCHDCVNHQ